MKTYFPADVLANDSTEYKLLNVTFCWFYSDEDYVQIIYQRGTESIRDSVDYAELRQLHPKLPEALESLIMANPQGSLGLAAGVIVVTSHVLGAVVDIKSIYPQYKGHRYMTDIAFVRSVPDTDQFCFVCDSYDVVLQEATGVFVPCTGLVHEVRLPAEAIDKIWPGSSRSIPAMEELGYAPEEIIKALKRPSTMNVMPSEMAGISLI